MDLPLSPAISSSPTKEIISLHILNAFSFFVWECFYFPSSLVRGNKRCQQCLILKYVPLSTFIAIVKGSLTQAKAMHPCQVPDHVVRKTGIDTIISLSLSPLPLKRDLVVVDINTFDRNPRMTCWSTSTEILLVAGVLSVYLTAHYFNIMPFSLTYLI